MEHIHTCISVHVADGNTNNDGEWMAVLRAAQYVSEHDLTDVEITTDSMVVTNQLSNNVGVNESRHAAVHDATAALLANCPRWRIRHVHRECNYGADTMATAGSDLTERARVAANGGVLEVEGRQMRVHHIEVAAMPGAVDASTRGRTTVHLWSCARPSANVHARLSTWSVHQLTSAAIQEWEVEAAIGWLKAGTAPGEDGVTPDMAVAAGQPMRRVLMGLFNKCWKVGSLPTRGKAHIYPHAAQMGQQAPVH
jgi:ribonuclease HI